MSNKKLIILGIIAACMVTWAIVQAHFSNRIRSVLETSANIIQGLDPSNIDAISLGTGDKEISLKRDGKSFVVTNKDNYPAVTGKINALISSCMDIKVEELYTDNPSNHKDLGVTEEEADRVIKFFKSDSELLVGIIVGKSKDQGRGTFVRVVPGNKVYVTRERPWIDDQVMNYVNKNIVTVDRQNIESVTVTSSGETYTLKSNDEGKGIILENLPSGKKLKTNDSENVFTVLKGLSFEDVMKSTTAEVGLEFNKKYVCSLKDSTVHTIMIAEKDDKAYITCHTDYTDKAPVTKEKGVIESEEELKKKEAKLFAQEKAQKMLARHKNWIYEIAEYDAKILTKQLSELFEEEEVDE